jgi:hypothetical protein
MVFHRQLYYEMICLCIDKVMNKVIEINEVHLNFLNYLKNLENFEDVYFLTSELLEYWAICIAENNKVKTELSDAQKQKFSLMYQNFLEFNKITDFIEGYSDNMNS